MAYSVLTSVSENWLVVEFENGIRDIVNVKKVVRPAIEDLKNGDKLLIRREDGEEAVIFVERAQERNMAAAINILKDAAAGPSGLTKDDEGGDFSESDSEWLPSEDGLSDSDDEVKTKKRKLENSENKINKPNKKVLTTSKMNNTVAVQTNNESEKIDLRNLDVSNAQELAKFTAHIENVDKVGHFFATLFDMVKELRGQVRAKSSEDTPDEQTLRVTCNSNGEDAHSSSDGPSNSNNSSNESNKYSTENEFDRSRDNILITNKFKRVEKPQKNDGNDGEWIAIGSGQTLIHKDQFKKVNFKSYTIATRTLLLAVFSRRTLATHSLTGKASPAFKHKKAKMCLDQRKTADVIMEVMERFNVPENLVRGIITTKCADECKMWKTRNKREMKNKENATTAQSSK